MNSSCFLFQAISFTTTEPGKRLIVTGAVHGNEVAGTHGIRRVIAEIESGALALARGSVTFVPITNPKAYALKRRNGDRNLNRNLPTAPGVAPAEFEDHIANWLCPLMAQHDALLDLHSFQAQGQAFVMVGAAEQHGRAGADRTWRHRARLGAAAGREARRGWLAGHLREGRGRAPRAPNASPRAKGKRHDLDAKYGVGTTEYMRSTGGMALTLECGQHDDPNGPEVAYRAIRNTLALFGLTDEPVPATETAMEGLHWAPSSTSLTATMPSPARGRALIRSGPATSSGPAPMGKWCARRTTATSCSPTRWPRQITSGSIWRKRPADSIRRSGSFFRNAHSMGLDAIIRQNSTFGRIWLVSPYANKAFIKSCLPS